MTGDVKNFLLENKRLVSTNLQKLFKLAEEELDFHDNMPELVHAFENAGINVLEKLTKVPNKFWYHDETHALVEIPSGVKEIGYRSFSDCKNLVSAKISNTVTKIDAYAFENCYNLQFINIPNSNECRIPFSVKMIDSRAFADTGIKEITIPVTCRCASDAFPPDCIVKRG